MAVDARFALIDLAGLAMEQDTKPARTDIANAVRRCRQVTMDQAGANTMTADLEVAAAILFAQLGTKAAALVDENAELIGRVAAALLEYGELDGDAIDRIMGESDAPAA